MFLHITKYRSLRDQLLRLVIVSLVVILVGGISASNSQTKKTAPKDTLSIAVEDGAGPWSTNDGTGFANDIVSAAFKSVNIEVSFLVMPYARCKYMVKNGDIAAGFSMSPSKEFAGRVTLSDEPLFTCFSDFFCKTNSSSKAKKQSDLPAKTIIGTVLGYEYPLEFENLKSEGQIVVEESPSEELNLKKLNLGRVDFALVNHNSMKTPEMIMSHAGVTGMLKNAFRSGVLKSYVGFSVKHPKGQWALKQYNKGFKIISENGTLKGITKKWNDTIERIRNKVRGKK